MARRRAHDGPRPLLEGDDDVLAEVCEEAAFHLEMTTRELVAAGLDPAAARREAERRFGDVDRHVRACRRIDERRLRRRRQGDLMGDLALDLRHALRSFRRNPVFVAVAVLTLALGIGANLNVFGMVDALALRPLPYADADELMIVWGTAPARGEETSNFSAPDLVDVRARARSFETLAGLDFWEANLTGVEPPRRLTGYRTAGDALGMLEVEPLLGRLPAPADRRPDAPPVVVLSHRVWSARFGQDPALVGETVELDGEAHTVIGVMPEGFEFPEFLPAADFWAPLQETEEQLAAHPRGRRFLTAVGRLADGVTAAEATDELEVVTAALEDRYPATNSGRRARVVGFHEQVVEPMRPALVILPIMVGLVLLICCANVANLSLARVTSRTGEIAVRRALGAGRGRIVRQLLTESVVLAALAGVLGFVLSEAAGHAILASLPDVLLQLQPTRFEEGISHRMVLFAGAVTLATALLSGLLPALRVTRPGLLDALRGEPGAAARGVGNRLRGALVVGEVAVSVILVVAAALMLKAFLAIVAIDPGFEARGALTMDLRLPDVRYPDDDARRQFYRRVLAGIEELPGVEAAGAANVVPLAFRDRTSTFSIEGRPAPDPESRPRSGYRVVTPGYLEALGLPVLRGRRIEAGDDEDARPVALVNRTLAERYFPDGDAIGGRIRWSSDEPWADIVGVVGDVRHTSLAFPPGPEAYVPQAQRPEPDLTLVVRTAQDPMSVADAVSRRVWEVDPDQPVDAVQPLGELVDVSLVVFRLPTAFMVAFALAALILATSGLYGVLSYLVALRSREIGVRVALGARGRDVVRLVTGRALGLAAVGVVVGLGLSLGVAAVIAALVQGVRILDPAVFGGVGLALLAVTLLATWIPARRAAAVDPVVALRADR